MVACTEPCLQIRIVVKPGRYNNQARFITASKDRRVVQGKSEIWPCVTWNRHADTQCDDCADGLLGTWL